MRCPYCHHPEDRVLESRLNSSGTAIRRRRECLDCGLRFTSYERILEKPLMVVKSDGRREPFDGRKVSRGVERSLEKRPVSIGAREELLQAVEDEAILRGRLTHEILASEIGELVLSKLFDLDKVAYVRFASVYKKFDDLEQFVNEINTLGKAETKRRSSGKKRPPLR
jgi:transcriptional repressor NrdR